MTGQVANHEIRDNRVVVGRTQGAANIFELEVRLRGHAALPELHIGHRREEEGGSAVVDLREVVANLPTEKKLHWRLVVDVHAAERGLGVGIGRDIAIDDVVIDLIVELLWQRGEADADLRDGEDRHDEVTRFGEVCRCREVGVRKQISFSRMNSGPSPESFHSHATTLATNSADPSCRYRDRSKPDLANRSGDQSLQEATRGLISAVNVVEMYYAHRKYSLTLSQALPDPRTRCSACDIKARS